ncbi:MAG: ComEC/Rec2 family competence protein, partial [Candidatus Zixiibacteriota bacterium]
LPSLLLPFPSAGNQPVNSVPIRKISTSRMIRKYPSVFLLSFIVTGIVLADQTHLSNWIFLLTTLVCFLGGFVYLKRHRTIPATIAFGLSLLFFSAFHFGIRFYDVGPRHISRVLEQGTVYHIFGRVSDWPDLKQNRTEVKLSLDSISSEVTQKVYGSILLKISDTTTALQRGDRIEFFGRIYPIGGTSIPGKFDYRRYLHLKDMYGIAYLSTLLDTRIDRANRYGLFNYIDRLRNSIRECFYENLSPEAAALAAGFLIGETRDIPSHIYKRFRDTGTLHLLAVSGSNVGLVILSFIVFLRPFSLTPRKRAVTLLGVIFVFALLSYGEPSVMRATIMASLIIIASIVQRRYDLNNIIATTAVIILLYNPTQLFDVSFQLSFVTAWGLIYVTPIATGFFKPYHARRWYRWVVFPIIISLIAQIFSMPLIALYFHRVPAVSVLANLVIVPMVSIAVMGIMLLLLANLIWPMLGAFVGSILNQLLHSIIALLSVLGGDKALLINISDLSSWLVLSFYVLLILAFWSLTSKRIRKIAIITFIAFVNVGLAVNVVEAVQRTNCPTIYLFSVPGGVAGFVKQADANQGDIIFTGLAGKDYQIEDRVITPILEGLKIRKLNSIFAISADFDAVDDIIRLSEIYQAKTIHIPMGLQKSFSDVSHINFSKKLMTQIIPSPNKAASPQEPGYYPSRWGVMVNFDSAMVVITHSINPDVLALKPSLKRAVLVVGDQLEADPSTYQLLRKAGYELAVCSRIRQTRTSLYSQAESQLAAVAPSFFYGLSDNGALKLEILCSKLNPLRIKALR